MDEYAAWKKFTETGSVNDYLAYCRIKLGFQAQDVQKPPEDTYDIQYGGTDSEGTAHWRER